MLSGDRLDEAGDDVRAGRARPPTAATSDLPRAELLGGRPGRAGRVRDRVERLRRSPSVQHPADARADRDGRPRGRAGRRRRRPDRVRWCSSCTAGTASATSPATRERGLLLAVQGAVRRDPEPPRLRLHPAGAGLAGLRDGLGRGSTASTPRTTGLHDGGADAARGSCSAHLDHWADLAVGAPARPRPGRAGRPQPRRRGRRPRLDPRSRCRAPYGIGGQVLIAPTDFALADRAVRADRDAAAVLRRRRQRPAGPAVHRRRAATSSPTTPR